MRTHSETISLKAAKRARAARIADLEIGSEHERDLARVLRECRKGDRCYSTECAVCGHFRVRKILRAQRLMDSSTSSGWTMRVPIDRITVDAAERRGVDTTRLAVIAASLREVGQIVPITLRVVQKRCVLVSGLHRLEAAKSIGWEHIYADVVVESREHARKEQLYENLARADLRVLDKAEYIVELRSLLIADAKVAQVARPGGAQPGEQYISKTAKRLGLSKDAVRRFVLIASLTATAKDLARNLRLDDNQSALLLAAHEVELDRQVSVLKDAARRASVKRGRSKAVVDEPVSEDVARLAAQIASDEKEIADLERKLESLSVLRAQRAAALAVHAAISEPDEVQDDVETVGVVIASPQSACDVLSELKARWDGLMGDLWPFVELGCRNDFISYIRGAKFAMEENREFDASATEYPDANRDRSPGVNTHNFELLRDGRGYMSPE